MPSAIPESHALVRALRIIARSTYDNLPYGYGVQRYHTTTEKGKHSEHPRFSRALIAPEKDMAFYSSLNNPYKFLIQFV